MYQRQFFNYQGQFINYEMLKDFNKDSFKPTLPFLWYKFHQFLTPQGFLKPYQEFPSIELFERHKGLIRYSILMAKSTDTPMNDNDKENTVHPDLARPYLPDLEQKVPVLKVLKGTLNGKEYQLEGEEVLIGRDKSSNIVIEEKEVSRRHAMIVKKASQFLLCDLDSSNGVYVNNLRLKKHVLKHGDLFQIGSCIFQFVWRQNKYEVQSKGQ